MKDDKRKDNKAPENYPRPETTDKQFSQQDEFIQKQSNKKENETRQTPDERRGGENETIGNP